MTERRVSDERAAVLSCTDSDDITEVDVEDLLADRSDDIKRIAELEAKLEIAKALVLDRDEVVAHLAHARDLLDWVIEDEGWQVGPALLADLEAFLEETKADA